MANDQAKTIPSLSGVSSFSPDSRVWVYTSNRPLTESEAAFAQTQLDAFCQQWTAHNQALLAQSEVYKNQLILLMVDETQAGASGCSIDKSVHFLEELGTKLGVDLFERMRFAWMDERGEIQFSNRPEFAALVQEGRIRPDTLVANTLVQTKQQLADKWWIPYSGSWHKRLV